MATFPSMTMGFPGGTTAGNNLAIVVFADQPITVPVGWNEFANDGGRLGGIFFSASIHTATAPEITNHTTWDWTFGGGGAQHFAYDIFDFANVTGLNTHLETPFVVATNTMTAPSVASSNNALCFAFWVVLGETPIRPADVANAQFGHYFNGGISHCVLGFVAGGATTGDIVAEIDVATTGFAAQASLTGAGSHLVSSTGGSIG